MDPDLGYTLYKLVFVLFVAWALAGRSLITRFHLGVGSVVVVAVALPLIVAVSFWDTSNIDIDHLRRTASMFRAGEDVYEAQWTSFFPFHPYLPLHMYVLLMADIAADFTPVPFALYVKLPAIAAAAGMVYLVYRAAKQSVPDESAIWLAGLVALNPISIWAVAVHGQFDTIATFLLLAAMCAQLGSESRRSLTVSGMLFGLAVSYKTWPLFAGPALVAWIPTNIGRVRFALIAAATISATILVYSLTSWTAPDDMLRVVREYRGVPGLAGYSRILIELPASEAEQRERLFFVLDHGTTILLVALVPICLLSLAARSRFLSITTVILGFYAFMPAGAGQYYVWIIPFALLAGQSSWLIPFSVVAGAFAGSEPFLSPLDPETPADVLNAMLWLFVVAWLGWNIGTIVNDRFAPAAAGERSSRIARATRGR